MAMTACRECGKPVSTQAKNCPHCGTSAPSKKKGKGGIGKLLLIVFAIGLVTTVLSKKDQTSIASAPQQTPAVRPAEAPKTSAQTDEKRAAQQKESDDLKAMLARQRAEAMAGWDEKTRTDAKQLVEGCLEFKICEPSDYRRLEGKTRSFVFHTLGDPVSSQYVGGRDIEYFNVPIEGKHSARLQLTYKYDKVDSVNVY